MSHDSGRRGGTLAGLPIPSRARVEHVKGTPPRLRSTIPSEPTENLVFFINAPPGRASGSPAA